eukprot:4000324-Pyramimonas_sp.AAC.1
MAGLPWTLDPGPLDPGLAAHKAKAKNGIDARRPDEGPGAQAPGASRPETRHKTSKVQVQGPRRRRGRSSASSLQPLGPVQLPSSRAPVRNALSS